MGSEVTVMQMFAPLQAINSHIFYIKLTVTDVKRVSEERVKKVSICLVQISPSD